VLITSSAVQRWRAAVETALEVFVMSNLIHAYERTNKIPDECLKDGKDWEDYWQALREIAERIMHKEALCDFEEFYSRGLLRNARIFLLYAVDASHKIGLIFKEEALQYCNTIAFKAEEAEAIRNAGYWVSTLVTYKMFMQREGEDRKEKEDKE